MDCPEGELSILIVDDSQIADLNRRYLDREGPTNVIAFPMQEGEFTQIAPFLVGDVVISTETAQREATDAGLSFERRFNQLLVHGILHLFGYDHGHDEAEAGAMDAKSGELMALIEGR